MTKFDIAKEAIEWVGTPYIHKARVKQVGVDCAQLVAAIAEKFNLVTSEQLNNIPQYDVEFHLHNREEKLLNILESFGCTRKDEIDIGDILAFRYGRSCSHLAIFVGNNQIVHANYMMAVPKTVCTAYNSEFSRRLGAIYSFPIGVK